MDLGGSPSLSLSPRCSASSPPRHKRPPTQSVCQPRRLSRPTTPMAADSSHALPGEAERPRHGPSASQHGARGCRWTRCSGEAYCCCCGARRSPLRCLRHTPRRSPNHAGSMPHAAQRATTAQTQRSVAVPVACHQREPSRIRNTQRATTAATQLHPRFAVPAVSHCLTVALPPHCVHLLFTLISLSASIHFRPRFAFTARSAFTAAGRPGSTPRLCSWRR